MTEGMAGGSCSMVRRQEVGGPKASGPRLGQKKGVSPEVKKVNPRATDS